MTFTMEIYYCHGEDRREWESAWFVSGNEVRTHNHSQIVVWRKECSDRPFFLPNKNSRKERGRSETSFIESISYLPYRNESHAISVRHTHTHTHTHKRCGTHHRTVHCSSQQSRLRQAYQLSIMVLESTMSFVSFRFCAGR